MKILQMDFYYVLNAFNASDVIATTMASTSTDHTDFVVKVDTMLSVVCALLVQFPTWFYIDRVFLNAKKDEEEMERRRTNHGKAQSKNILIFFVTSNLACLTQTLLNILYTQGGDNKPILIQFLHDSLWLVARLFFYYVIIQRLKSVLLHSTFQYQERVYWLLHVAAIVQSFLGSSCVISEIFLSDIGINPVAFITIFVCDIVILDIALIFLFSNALTRLIVYSSKYKKKKIIFFFY
ncbi:hypothetical protein RFI_14704 [Reticulomyxa filosa]|uniref:Uncharacterized protein n=1 Tax=Reticulomyxa filosa TaxID=46433 RepID=X6N895_RETFI|nr:hypothetical protein RFI_14704 [Reticulomyxa filosa]|eukprot:ETO22495.1 hypothetical protein RFI_14704 [Reticulomyxa filosa]